MFGLDVIFQIIFTVESFLTKVTLEAIVEAAAVVDVTADDDIQTFTATYQQFSKNHYHHSPHIYTYTCYEAQNIISSPINKFYIFDYAATNAYPVEYQWSDIQNKLN